MYRIARREALTPQTGTFLWEVHAPDVAAAARPGQFVMVHLHEGSERVPLTIADFDRRRGTVTLVVQPLGRSTREMRDHYDTGDTFDDLVGPLGNPTEIERVGHVVLVGGGLGVAPIYPQLRAFKLAGNRTTAILGFRTAELRFWEDRLGEFADELIVCTDDGTAGRPGQVTAALAEVIERDRPDLVLAVGPMVMMRACAEATRAAGVPTVVSMNTIMVDGTGMCGSCRVSVDGQTRFACVDGPDFDAHAIDFDELLQRQRRFAVEEQAASADYEHRCKVGHELFDEGRRTYKKLREIEPTRVPMPERDPVARARTFDEVTLGYSLSEALREAERCLQCSRPTCISGCPVAVDIPRFIRHLLIKDVDGALGVILEANVLPSVCGRVCPQETQCEAQCVIGRKLEPVAIGRLERFVGDHGHVTPAPVAATPVSPAAPRSTATPAPPRRRVAVVGSGPAGLACAADLARIGVDVTVFEALHVTGGVLRYGIPAFRLPREIIDREVAALAAHGVRFETDTVIGRTFTVDDLLGRRGFDAVFLGVGAGSPSFLGIPGEHAGRVVSANELLTRVNLMGGDRFPDLDTPVGIGDDVVVVGAGNTAMDCLRTAKRLGASRVRCVYRRSRAEAPARVEELHHAEQEGIEMCFLTSPVEVLTDDQGSVRGLVVEEMQLGEPDERGRRSPVGTGVRRELTCDTVVVALGTNANPVVTRTTPGLALDRRGYVMADAITQATSLPGVFAGGDIVTGGATVILAMGAGRRAAASIAAHLAALDAQAATLPDPALSEATSGCPRCRRPQAAGDEDGICCAGAALAWRCTECGKRSEGFALPHGRCPACGGLLAVLEVPGDAVLGDQELEIVRRAVEIELGGRDFYLAAAVRATDPDLRELFASLAAMEREHLDTLVRRYHLDAPPQPTGELGPSLRQAAVPGVSGTVGLDDIDDPRTLLDVAITLEQRAEQFFLGHAAGDAASAATRLARELAAEESEHVAILTTERSALARGRRGLLRAEPSSAT